MKKNVKKINLRQEILLQVAGEEEKKHTLSWDLLKKIGDNTQNLIDTLAKVSIDENKIPYEATKLIFVGFYAGSSIAGWRIQDDYNYVFPIKDQVENLNNDLGFILGSLNSGNFQAIADNYSDPYTKNLVVDAVYNFTNSVGTKAFSVVKRDIKKKSGYSSIAKIRKMSVEQKTMLHAKVDNSNDIPEPEITDAVASLTLKKNKDGKLSKKNMRLYSTKDVGLGARYDSIETDKRIYYLNDEIVFSIDAHDKKNFVIEHKLLDIYAFGKTISEAKADMSEQFDYTFQRLTVIADSNLSVHLLRAKKFILMLVNNVKEK